MRPASSYYLAYEAGAVLAPHIDREQCEYTVSLLLEGTAEGAWEPWPLWLKVNGEPVAAVPTSSRGPPVLVRTPAALFGSAIPEPAPSGSALPACGCLAHRAVYLTNRIPLPTTGDVLE